MLAPLPPTAHTPSAATALAAADLRQRELDDVMLVLRSTSDGEELAPGDLALAEAVANYGAAFLKREARNRWAELVRVVSNGQYEKPWLHGIEHLTKDSRGYICWKGSIVERFSYRDYQREQQAAHRLAGFCQYLEAAGRPLNSSEVLRAQAEARFGQGMNTPRWILVWVLEPDRARTSFTALACSTQALADAAVETQVAACAQSWSIPREKLCSCTVTSREDFDLALEQLRQSHRWACEKLHWRSYRYAQSLHDLLHQVAGHVRREDLPTRDDLEARYLHGDVDAECDIPLDAAVPEPGTQRDTPRA